MIDFGRSLFTPEYWADPHGSGALARDRAAVHVDTLPSGVRAWVITRYDDAKAALADPRLVKAAAVVRAAVVAQLTAAGHDPQAASVMFTPHMIFADGQEHARLRRLVSSVLTRKRMEAMAPLVETMASDLIARMSAVDGPVDVVSGLAFPLPLGVICDLLGVPLADRPRLRQWTIALMDEDPHEVVPASAEMARYVMDLIEARRADPADDLVSYLATAGSAGDRLSAEELLGTIVLLIVAGHDTTSAAITNAIAGLLSEPTRWKALIDNPSDVPAAVEELIRLEGAVRHATYRVAAEPVTIGGITIPAGEVVLVSLISANRDPMAFANPTAYEPGGRGATQHLGFGHGPHYCLGAPLARIELATVLRLLTTRHPNARLAEPAAPPAYTRSPITVGRHHLHVVLN